MTAEIIPSSVILDGKNCLLLFYSKYINLPPSPKSVSVALIIPTGILDFWFLWMKKVKVFLENWGDIIIDISHLNRKQFQSLKVLILYPDK